MRLIYVAALVLGGSFVVALAALACAEPSIDIVQTQFAETRATSDAATSVAQATLEASGGIDVGSLSGQMRATFAAEATVTAVAKEAGIVDVATAVLAAEVPPGDPLTGNVEVEIQTGGKMVPDVIKVSVGTTVTWVNVDKWAHNVVVTNADAPEQFQSENLAWPFGGKDPVKFEYTFGKAGKYEYGSRWQGERTNAVVWVVEQ